VSQFTRLCLFIGVGSLVVACQDVADPGPRDDGAEAGEADTGIQTAPSALAGEAAVDVAVVMDRAAVAIRADRSGYVAKGATHAARIDDGIVTFTPSHWDGKRTVTGAPITLGTRSIERGGELAADLVLQSRVVDGNGLELDRGGSVELIENLPDGIEQSWRFANEPTGSGDLVVRVAAAGFTEATATPTGVHLMNPGRLGVRYSNATWIDSAGEAWSLPSTWDGTDIVITVPADMIERTMFPAVLDPTVGSQTAVDSPVAGYSGASAREPAVAYNGTNWLVVWRDNRRSSDDSDIFGARIAADGSVLDPNGIAIGTAAGNQTLPAVTFANNKYVVAWESAGDIIAATVTSNGVVAQLGAVAATGAVETEPSFAPHGNNPVLVFQSDAGISASRYSGTAFAAPFAISAAGTSPAGAGNPAGGYLIAWSEGAIAANLRGQLLTAGGALDGAAFDISAGNGVQSDPSASWTGTDYVVAFTNTNTDIYATRVTTAGVVSDTHLEDMVAIGGKVISAAAGNQVASSTSCNAAGCLVVWSDRRNLAANGADIYAQRTDAALALQGGEIVVANPIWPQTAPAVTSGAANGWFAIWADERTGGPPAAIGSRISAVGAVQDASGIVANRNRNAQVEPAYARSPAFQLAVWSDSRTFGSQVRAVRYDNGGTKLDANGVALSNNAAHQSTPATAFDGTNFLVVWDDGRNPSHDIFAGRFSTAGATLDGTGIPVATAANDQLVPDVASSGAGVSLVVWQDRRNSTTTGFDIYGAIVTSAGTVTVADIAICDVAGDQNRPAVTYDPVNAVFVVAWSDVRNAGDADVFAARVSTAGAVLDAGGVQVSSAANGQFSPDIAHSGTQLLVTWDDRRTDNGDIYGARLTAAGALTVLDPAGLAINTSVNAQSTPTSIGMANGQWVVVWTDERNIATTRTDIWGVQVDAQGAPASATGDLISADADNEGDPALQPDPNSTTRIGLVYQRYRADLDAVRVQRRGITYVGGPQGASCTSDAQCTTTGFCVDGFCCDTACGGTFNNNDCQACSVTRGAVTNGTCAVVADNRVCRKYADPAFPFCDVREKCDGSAGAACPPDLGRNGGLACTGAGGPGTCPANDVTGSPHVCQ
jgi:hypothetical protein